MVELIVLLIFMLTGTISWIIFRDPMHPSLIHSAIWSFNLLFYVSSGNLLYRVSFFTLILIALGNGAFFLGTLLINLKKKRSINITVKNLPSHRLIYLVLIACSIAAPFFYFEAIRIGSSVESGSLLNNIRMQAAAGDGFGRFSIFLWLSFVNAGYCLVYLYSGKAKDCRFVALYSVMIAFFYAYFFAGRNFLIFIFLILFSVSIIFKRVSIAKVVIILPIIVTVIFISYAFLLGHIRDNGSVYGQGIIEQIGGIATLYFAGSLPALDTIVSNTSDFEGGINSFRNINLWLNQLGFDSEIPQLVQEYVFIPLPTNIYTIYLPYFKDFGFVGATAFQFLLGLLYGYLYLRIANQKVGSSSIILYSLSLYPLIMQYAVDAYLSILSQWVLILIFVIVYKFSHLKIENSVTLDLKEKKGA
jgi:oligosaccharide repeat unit polymerase